MSFITRRDFLKTGAMAVAYTGIPLFFRANPLAAFATPPENGAGLSDYYDHFGVDENIIGEVIGAALEKGGDYCDLYFQHRLYNSIALEDNAVNRAHTTVDYGVGIRVIKNDRTGFSFTEELTPKSMKLAARTAANIADGPAAPSRPDFSYHSHSDYYPIETPWEEIKIDKKIPYLQQLNEKMRSLDSRVIKTRLNFSDQSCYILQVNSDGRVVFDYRPLSLMRVSCNVEQKGVVEQNSEASGGRVGIDYYSPERLDRLARETVDRAILLFDAVKPEPGEMEVILSAGSSGILLHEAIGHPLEADFNRKNTSIFADKMNQPVAEKFVSIVDDGTQPHFRGAINVDDEGNDTEKTYLVTDGILTSYMHDHISAKHYGVAPTGSGRRESFRFAPQPRMRSTYMLPGPHKREEIIGSVKKGIMAESFTNGEVHIGPGDFTFYVKIGYLIEDGKVTRPVKDINLIGNGPEVLSKVVMVGDDLEYTRGGWTCGKGGQSVPVSMGLPTVKVASITVGGSNS